MNCRLSDSASLQATPQHNALIFLVACIFSIDIGYIPAAQYPLLLSPWSFIKAAIFQSSDLQISPFVQYLPTVSCWTKLNVYMLTSCDFCVTDQKIKLDVFHVMNSVRNIYFVICNDSNLKEWGGNGRGGNLSTPNAASCFLDRCLFWVVWFCTDVHIHKVEK